MTAIKKFPTISSKIGQTSSIILVLLIAFAFYAHTEKQVDRANEQRQLSYQLADQLRQSSDDLTRMVRTYVVSGDAKYKKYYQDILDIRNGMIPRPERYAYIYWDLVLTNQLPPPDEKGHGIALLDLMGQAGFTAEEFGKLAEAKANSDNLTTLEFEAMKLAESVGPGAEANRERARLMLHDENYHQAKARIMQPISESFLMMDKRTAATVRSAESLALLFRWIFLVSIVGAIFMLWRTYAAVRATLGGTVDEVHTHMLRIGHGDLSARIPVAPGMESSVLAGLSEMQNKLLAGEIERKQSQDQLAESEQRYRILVENSPFCIHEIDLEGRLQSMNRAGLNMLGLDDEKKICGLPYLTAVSDQDNGRIKALLQDAFNGTASHFEFAAAGDVPLYFKSCFIPIKNTDGAVVELMGLTEDITERKKAELELRIAATAFEAHVGMTITDADGTIIRVNQAFTDITGYSAEDVISKNSNLLQSGMHSPEFYAAMWESINNSGTWEGEIWNKRKNGELYPEHLVVTAVKNSAGAVTNYVGTLTDITKAKAAAEEIEYLAFYDSLTKLPNRRLMLDRLNQALASCTRSGRKGALLFIDLDDFKTLNDTLGHDIGDLLLKQVAERLISCVREGDTVARFGGDEFVVMLEELSEHSGEAAAQTELVGNKILDSLNQPYQLASHQHHNTPSIGATLFNDHQSSVEELLKQADIAMYQAKHAGRNTLRFFDPEMQASITARAAMEADLRLALVKNQFKLYYQLQATHEGEAVGAEVLIRWQHPVRGLVSPAEFIPLAEETGLILPIGLWVFEMACTQLEKWKSDPLASHLQLAVNVSARQFHQPDFVEQVHAVLKRFEIAPGKLKLELTESMVLDDIDATISKMRSLMEFGVRFSLDDFGTGFSSLAYLTRLPLAQLKIDKSFVRNIGVKASDAVIVQTIIGMAKNLEMEVIAEGVETEEQRSFLEQHGCPLCQGYLFGKPVQLDEFESLRMAVPAQVVDNI